MRKVRFLRRKPRNSHPLVNAKYPSAKRTGRTTHRIGQVVKKQTNKMGEERSVLRHANCVQYCWPSWITTFEITSDVLRMNVTWLRNTMWCLPSRWSLSGMTRLIRCWYTSHNRHLTLVLRLNDECTYRLRSLGGKHRSIALLGLFLWRLLWTGDREILRQWQRRRQSKSLAGHSTVIVRLLAPVVSLGSRRLLRHGHRIRLRCSPAEIVHGWHRCFLSEL